MSDNDAAWADQIRELLRQVKESDAQLTKAERLIRELVAALQDITDYPDEPYDTMVKLYAKGCAALAKAKAAGFEP